MLNGCDPPPHLKVDRPLPAHFSRKFRMAINGPSGHTALPRELDRDRSKRVIADEQEAPEDLPEQQPCWLKAGPGVHPGVERELLKFSLVEQWDMAERVGFEPPIWLERAIFLLRNDWHSSVNGALLWVAWADIDGSGFCPAALTSLAGLGWCGGWRRVNHRGSHEQGKI